MQSLDPGRRRPPESEFVPRVLYDLKSPMPRRRLEALGRLAHAPAAESRVAVAKAVEPALGDPDREVRVAAARALAVWGGRANTAALIPALGDPEPNVRQSACDAVIAIKDPAAAAAVAALLVTDRGKAVATLKALGTGAERAILPYLAHSDVNVRAEVCRLLREIGTAASRPPLLALVQATGGQGPDGSAAREALDALERGANR